MFLISAIAAFLSLDNLIGNFMISRPFIGGIIVGTVLGDIKTGLIIGVIFELIWIDTFPIGTFVAPELLASSILSSYWCISYSGRTENYMIVTAVALSVPFGYLYRRLDVLNRQFNSKVSRIIDKAVDKGNENAVMYYSYGILFFTALKAFAFFVIFLYFGREMFMLVDKYMPVSLKIGLGYSIKFLPVIGFSIAYNFFLRRKYEKC
ncbi:MAG: hypothetical protein A2252_00515 [Elusimicrobia bacterium RIFOXYA2_FULL_39_19]|nr:MAG: hypothetical protein A2252_00515 [Elusimicrobia bacterium RIFOXYA2_FULL_39_19]